MDDLSEKGGGSVCRDTGDNEGMWRCNSDRGSFICLLDLNSWSLWETRLLPSIPLHVSAFESLFSGVHRRIVRRLPPFSHTCLHPSSSQRLVSHPRLRSPCFPLTKLVSLLTPQLFALQLSSYFCLQP